MNRIASELHCLAVNADDAETNARLVAPLGANENQFLNLEGPPS